MNRIINKSMNYLVGLDTFDRIVKYNTQNTESSGGYDSLMNDKYFICNRVIENLSIDYNTLKEIYESTHTFIDYRVSDISSTMIRNQKTTL